MRNAVALFCLICGAADGAAPPRGHDPQTLVLRLGSETYHERERASTDLAALGMRAAPALLAAYPVNGPEIRRRVRRLLDALAAEAEREVRLLARQGVKLTTRDGEPASAIIEIDFGTVAADATHFELLALLPELKELAIRKGRRLTDDSLRCLAACPSLERLVLGVNDLTDEGICCLARITSLKRLNLTSSRASGTGFRAFKADSLRQLYCNSASLGDDGVKTLARIESLETLMLVSQEATDRSVMELAKHPNLNALTVISPHLTDDCLKPFAFNRKLIDFALSSRNITAKAHAVIERTLPALQVPTHSEPRPPKLP